MIYWYLEGQKWLEENYINGKKSGLKTGWYPNGRKSIEQNWKDDKPDGLLKEWYGNGQIKKEGRFRDGKNIGEWIYFNKDGSIDRLENNN